MTARRLGFIGAMALALSACGGSTPEPESTVDAPPTATSEVPEPTERPTASIRARQRVEATNGDYPMDPITHVLALPSAVSFKTGRGELREESDAVLGYIQKYLNDNPGVTLLRVEGHSDNLGSDAANQKLTEKRALEVVKWLVAHRIDCKRLLAVGFGEKKPIADNKSAEGRAKNRRIDFVEVEYAGKPIGQNPRDGDGTVAGDSCSL